MCYQAIELYGTCRCLYYQHAVDKCPRYGKRGHGITQRTILVGYACPDHAGEDGVNRLKDPAGQLSPVFKDKAPLKAPARSSMVMTIANQSEGKETGLNEVYSKQFSGSLSSSSTAIQTSNISATGNTARASQANATPEPTTIYSISSSSLGSADPKLNNTDLNDKEVETTEASVQRSITREAQDFESYVFGDDEESDSGVSISDESVVSESQSVTCLASTNDHVDSDATEAISRRLLLFGNLPYLWPQLLRRCRSRSMSVTTMERMLRRFSEDLAGFTATMHEPDTSICLNASQFIRKSRLIIAHRIWEAHCEGADDQGERGKNNSDDPDGVEDYNDKDFTFEVPERFIFDTTPILAFEANVKTFVGLSHAQDDRISSRLYRSAEVCFSNLRFFTHEPLLKPGKQRVRWKCVSQILSYFEP